MNVVGFKTEAYKTANYLPVVVEPTEVEQNEPLSLEDALKKVGWKKAQELVLDFLMAKYPNQHQFTEQMTELKKRFFAPI